MIEDVFLTYANNSLKENPAHLLHFFDEVKKNIRIDLRGAYEVTRIICDFSGETDDMKIIYPAWKSGEVNTNLWEFDRIQDDNTRYFSLAISAIAQTRLEFYLKTYHYRFISNELARYRQLLKKKPSFMCSYRQIRSGAEGRDYCEEGFRWKCYECQQSIFIDFLASISNGDAYSQIDRFNLTMISASEMSTKRTDYRISLSKPVGGKEILEAATQLTMGLNEFLWTPLPVPYDPFGSFVEALAAYSLIEFLLHNDRRRLKRCPYCKNFFVPENIRRSRCKSLSCEKAFQREKKRKQRDLDPVKYYTRYPRN